MALIWVSTGVMECCYVVHSFRLAYAVLVPLGARDPAARLGQTVFQGRHFPKDL